MRLACSDFAAAVDSSTTAYQRLKVRAWAPEAFHNPVRISSTIKHLIADVSSAQDWQQVLLFVQQLPHLQTLSCEGRRVWPLQLPAGFKISPHVKLRAVQLRGTVTSLVQLSELAPQLNTFTCDELVVQSASAGVANSPGVPYCTTFAANQVKVMMQRGECSDTAASAFAAALPCLESLAGLPRFVQLQGTPSMGYRGGSELHPSPSLLHCKRLHSLRMRCGQTPDIQGTLSGLVQKLQHIHTLALHDDAVFTQNRWQGAWATYAV